MTATTKHTPGPWKIYQSQATMPRVIVSADGSSVADANAGFPCAEDEQDANARLIAAAPDLLDALRILEEFVTELTKAGEDRQNRLVELEGDKGNRLFAARAAIATAGGAA